MPRFRKTEQDLVTHFDKWMYVLKNLPKLHERPQKLREKVFEKLFNEAELAKLNPEEMKAYDESLKVYRDNKNTMDYAIQVAREEGRQEARLEERTELARRLKQKGVDMDIIAETTQLSRAFIENL
jgi:predicted transposase/invertase (TIGR01784 family)